MPSNHLIFYRPLLLLPSIFPSIRLFSNELALHIRWPNYWSFSFNTSPSNEHSGLISFRMDWLDLLAVRGILKSLLQHHISKASILWHSAFFIVQLLHPCMTTGKTIALDLSNGQVIIWTLSLVPLIYLPILTSGSNFLLLVQICMSLAIRSCLFSKIVHLFQDPFAFLGSLHFI